MVKAGIEKMLRVVALSKLVLAVLSPSSNIGIVEDDVCFRERTVFQKVLASALFSCKFEKDCLHS